MTKVKFRRDGNLKVEGIMESGRMHRGLYTCNTFFFFLGGLGAKHVGGHCFTLYFMCLSNNSLTIKII